MVEAKQPVYDREFFERRKQFVADSSAVMVPILCELFSPLSVVDVGCGQGAWLRGFLDAGVDRVLGIDGDYVDENSLEIERENFLRRDLSRVAADVVSSRFDLVLCLEVAEHLPESCSDRFAEFLTSLGDVVVFSAAVPGQHGVGHINCQWPPYWIHRFEHQGYRCADVVRPRIWQDPAVATWYQQNTFVFAPIEVIKTHPALAKESLDPYAFPTLIDPRLLWKGPPGVRDCSRALVNATTRAVKRRLRLMRQPLSRG